MLQNIKKEGSVYKDKKIYRRIKNTIAELYNSGKTFAEINSEYGLFN